MTSVGDDFPNQQARARELLDIYRTIPTGGFGALMIEEALQRADQALASGDIVAIVRSYNELVELK